MKSMLIAGFALTSLAGCTAISAIGGNTSDCATAQKQLNLERASLTVAQLVLSNAEAIGGSPPAIAAAQSAVNLINTDIASIQLLVTQSCAAPAPPAAMMVRAARVVPITLADAVRLAKADKQLAESLRTRTK